MDIGKSFAGEILKELKQQTYAFCDFKDAQLTSLDLSGKHFIACNFGNTRFVSVQLNKTKFDACFSSVYAKTHAVDTHFEKATILNTHFVIDKGESREYITMWDDEMEELIYDAQNIEGIDYTISRKIEALLKKEFENSLFLRLHLCAALFAEDGFHRSWMLVRLVNPKFCDSPGYGELFRLFIVSFLGDAYVGVREECLEHLKELQPTKKMLGLGVNRIFLSDKKEIAKGLRQLRQLLSNRLIDRVSKKIEDRVDFLKRTNGTPGENEISYLSNFASDDIAYYQNKNN